MFLSTSLYLSPCVAWKCWRCSCSQQLETDLKIEREWRQTLQSDLDRERDSVAQLSTEALQINGLKKVKGGGRNRHTAPPPIMLDLLHVCCWLLIFFQEFHRLQDENIQLKTICEDQEQALEELGSKLSEYVGFEKA